MEYRKLSRTIESIVREAPSFKNTEELLIHVIKQIINIEDINITGGRLWKFDTERKSYFLIGQTGDVEHIEQNYELKSADYENFKEVGRYRTVLAKETDEYLLTKGIHLYSATGVGERYKFRSSDGKEINYFYQYLIALNGKKINEDFLNTLNIISVTLTSVIRSLRIESSVQENIKELEKASEIQRNILPEHELKFGNYEIFGISLPDKIVGGDFFDYIPASDGYRLGVAIGDAASKGISAAAQALYVSGALKMGVEYDIAMTNLVNKISNLVYNTFPFERFVTLFYCEIYNDTKGLCVYVNAGHNMPFQYRAKNGKILNLSATGPVLGPSPDQKYNIDSFYIDVNDILLLYTDGIVEATNRHFKFYGEKRLKRILNENINKSPKEICEAIIEDVQIYSAKGKYSDDKTLVVIKRVK